MQNEQNVLRDVDVEVKMYVCQVRNYKIDVC